MNRDENQFHYASKRERLLAVTIFLLMLMSFFLHLCAFSDIFFRNLDYQQKNQTEIRSEKQYFIF
jgi:hypothetical protein